jgi:hypothetical protein
MEVITVVGNNVYKWLYHEGGSKHDFKYCSGCTFKCLPLIDMTMENLIGFLKILVANEFR